MTTLTTLRTGRVLVTAVALLGLVGASCKDKRDSNAPLGPQQQGALLLKPVGSAKIDADRNSEITLKIVATYVEVGPASDLPVEVSFVGGARTENGGILEPTPRATNQNGFLIIKYTTPDVESANVQVRFQAQGAPAVTLTVSVGKEIVTLDWAGKKPHLLQKDTDDDLTVTAVNQRGAPVSGVEVTVELVGQSEFGAGFVGVTTAHTDGSGKARFVFAAGSEVTTYTARASAPKLNDAKLEIVVAEHVPEDEPCSFSSECGPGEVCSNGLCVTGDRRCRMAHPEDCPDGYVCSDNICVSGQGCPCEAGYTCTNNVCISDAVSLDVTGRWKTQYAFDLSETLGVLSEIAGPISTVDTLFQGKLPIDIPILGPLIELMLTELIKRFVPDWVPKLASALNALEEAFKDMHVLGTMALRVQPGGDPNVLQGEEVWKAVEVNVITLCPRRQYDPNYPACAKVDLQLGRNLGGGMTAGAEAKPFSGLLSGTRLALDHREAEIEIKLLVSNLLDLLANIVSNGRAKTLEEAVVQIVDCPNLNIAADKLVCDLTDGGTCHLGWFQPVCTGVATLLGNTIGAIVDRIPVKWTLLDFHQEADAVDSSSPADRRADKLMNGVLEGATNFFTDRPMTGTWEGKR